MTAPTPIIDGYRIEQKLAEGGMGVVYRAIDERLGRPVAVKMIRGELLRKSEGGDDAVARFLREARAAAQISSNHVATVLQFGETQTGDLYLVLEYLNGMGLDALLKQEGRLSVERAVNITRQICRGLEAAHQLGIVHRDLKPANIFLVDQDGKQDFVKILDFGVAKVQGEAESHATKVGMLVGTYTCMAPEQVLGDPVDARTDIYALAVLLFRMLTGKQLFSGDNITAVLYHHVHTPARAPSQVVPEIGAPRPLEMVLLRCLEKDPSRRIATMVALERALAASVDFSGPTYVDPAAATVAISDEQQAAPGPSATAVTSISASIAAPAPAPADPPTPSTSTGQMPVDVAIAEPSSYPHLESNPAVRSRAPVMRSVGLAALGGVVLAVLLVSGLWWLMRAAAPDPLPAATVTAKAPAAPVEEPVAEPPVADEPVAEPPVADEPAAEPPVADEPIPVNDAAAGTKTPATEAAATEATTTKKSATKKAATKKAATKKAAAKKAAAKKAAAKKSPPTAADGDSQAEKKKKPGFIRVRTRGDGG